MRSSGGGLGGRTRPHCVLRNAAVAPMLALLGALLVRAEPALALTPSSTTVIPAVGAAGQGIPITVLVSGGDKPGGTVTVNFGDGATSPPMPLADGAATVIHIYAGPGSYGVTVNYSGDDSFAPSTGIGTATVNFYP
jgi:Bacterial Ig-like domain (group 3)